MSWANSNIRKDTTDKIYREVGVGLKVCDIKKLIGRTDWLKCEDKDKNDDKNDKNLPGL